MFKMTGGTLRRPSRRIMAETLLEGDGEAVADPGVLEGIAILGKQGRQEARHGPQPLSSGSPCTAEADDQHALTRSRMLIAAPPSIRASSATARRPSIRIRGVRHQFLEQALLRAEIVVQRGDVLLTRRLDDVPGRDAIDAELGDQPLGLDLPAVRASRRSSI